MSGVNVKEEKCLLVCGKGAVSVFSALSAPRHLRQRTSKGGLGCLCVQKRSDADQEKSLGTDCRRHGDRMKEPITWRHARAPCACRRLEIIGSA